MTLTVEIMDMCREPAYGPAGWGSAYKSVPHLWAMSPDGKWFYCTRCTATRPGPEQNTDSGPVGHSRPNATPGQNTGTKPRD